MSRPNLSPFTAGVLLLIFGALSVQLGASIGTSIIPTLGVYGVVLARYTLQACVHIPLAWKHLRRARLAEWWWGALVAAPLLAMNLTIYLAFSHIGVGLAVTIELMGPITLAVLTARSRPGWLAAGLAAAGMVLVTDPTGDVNVPGVLWSLAAAAGWAFYLLATRKAGQQLEGLTPSAMASVIGLSVLIPLNLIFTRPAHLNPTVLLLAVLAGVLSSAIPYACDLLALRRVPMNVASTMMSINPVTASMWGAIILGERFGALEIAGLAIICVANVLVVRAARRPR
ncbi:DMT family transporter [uncultured Tessaracoccus sp.]|uniref:EamA family transporter n=1 Tax=uncultured Tessaracoccus sp. TaxID=905023 RepID=UPI0026316B93|nr:EamA family transporter [uncultured Tessaracoccus sp.]